MKKRIWVIVISLLAILFITSDDVWATDQSDFTYEKLSNNYIHITSYIGSSEDIVQIPEKIDNKEVVSIDSNAFIRLGNNAIIYNDSYADLSNCSLSDGVKIYSLFDYNNNLIKFSFNKQLIIRNNKYYFLSGDFVTFSIQDNSNSKLDSITYKEYDKTLSKFTTKSITFDNQSFTLKITSSKLYIELDTSFFNSFSTIENGYQTVGIVAPTCTLNGRIIKRNKQGQTKTVVIPAGHTWGTNYKIDSYPSYTKTGIKSIHCNLCNAKKPHSEVVIPKLSKTSVSKSLTVYANEKLNYKYNKSIYNNMTVKYSSSNSKIAKVSSKGKVTFYKAGKVKIYAKTGGVINEILYLTVIPGTNSASLSSNGKRVKISFTKSKGATKYQIYRATKINGKYTRIVTTKKLYYYDTKVIRNRIYYYKVKAIGNGYNYTTGIMSKKVAKPKKYLNKTNVILTKNLTTRLKLYNNSSKITWSSSNKKVATVSSTGLVTGKKAGSVYITAKVGLKKYKCLVRVNNPSIILDKTSVLITERLTNHLTATVKGKSKKVTWSTSNSNIVTVGNNGNIQGQMPGVATVYAKANGVTAKTIVTVKKYDVKAVLDSLDLTNVDNLLIVAHPDDDTLWGGAHLIRDNFLVVNVTAGCVEYRGNEFRKAMSMLGDIPIPLGYTDMIDSNKANKGTKYDWPLSYRNKISQDLKIIMNYKNWNLIATHNPIGEYGHIHHRYTNQMVTNLYKQIYPNDNNLYYFGHYFAPLNSYYLDENVISNDEFKKKNEVLATAYVGQTKTINVFNHMNRFENWINSNDWVN